MPKIKISPVLERNLTDDSINPEKKPPPPLYLAIKSSNLCIDPYQPTSSSSTWGTGILPTRRLLKKITRARGGGGGTKKKKECKKHPRSVLNVVLHLFYFKKKTIVLKDLSRNVVFFRTEVTKLPYIFKIYLYSCSQRVLLLPCCQTKHHFKAKPSKKAPLQGQTSKQSTTSRPNRYLRRIGRSNTWRRPLELLRLLNAGVVEFALGIVHCTWLNTDLLLRE